MYGTIYALFHSTHSHIERRIGYGTTSAVYCALHLACFTTKIASVCRSSPSFIAAARETRAGVQWVKGSEPLYYSNGPCCIFHQYRLHNDNI